MNDYYGEIIWQYVDYCKYFNRHSTRLDVQPWQTWGNVISFKAKTKKIPKTYLKRSNRRILQPGTHSRSTKKENRIASNGAIPASPLRMWVTVVTGTGVVKGSECCDWEQLISRGN